jgi:dTDP-4-amino-4,6-dideoxygalactose transaminase
MSKNKTVPFNDLSRIHRPLLKQFKGSFTRLVESSSLVLGQEVLSFEQELAMAEGCEFAIGVNNGTSAIELALRAFDIGDGDEVITTAFTFIATSFSILQTGATPVLVDIDPLTGLMDPSRIEGAITPRTKAVVFVTLHGRVENLDLIRSICIAHNLRFVIDAAQSHLGTLNGRPQSDFCDAATLSFYPGKNLGALGEGGAVLTNSKEIKDRIILMRDWGASEKYNHTVWGGNFRLESMQASFLRIKLRELHSWTRARQQIADSYRERIKPHYLMKRIGDGSSHVYHIFSIVVADREKFCDHLAKNEIGFGFHYPKAIHQQPAFIDKTLTPMSLSNSEYLARTTISLPIFPGQTDFEIDRVIEIVNSGITD